MDHLTAANHRITQQRFDRLERETEIRRRIAERPIAAATFTLAAQAPQPHESRWHVALVRAHLARPIAH